MRTTDGLLVAVGTRSDPNGSERRALGSDERANNGSRNAEGLCIHFAGLQVENVLVNEMKMDQRYCDAPCRYSCSIA